MPYDKNSKLYRATKKASQKACRFDGLVHEMIVFLIAAHNHTYTRLGPQPAVTLTASRLAPRTLQLIYS